LFKNLLSLLYFYKVLLNKEAVVALLSSYPNRPTGVVDGCIMVAIGRECHCFSMAMSDNAQIVNKMFIENYFFLSSSIHAKLRLLDCNITLYSIIAGKSTPKSNFFQSFFCCAYVYLSLLFKNTIILGKNSKVKLFLLRKYLFLFSIL